MKNRTPHSASLATPAWRTVVLRLRANLAGLRRLDLVFFGFAFARAWNDVAFLRLAWLSNAAWVGQDLLTLAMSAVFLVCLLAARRLAPLGTKRWPYAVVLISTVLCAVLLGIKEPPSSQLLAVAGIIGGVGAACSVLLWAELQSCFNSYRIVLYVSGGFLGGAVLGWLLEPLEGIRLTVAMLTLTLCSLGCLIAGFKRIPACDLPRASWGKLRFPWRLVLVLGVYEFVLGLQETGGTSSGALFSAGVAISAAAIFLFASIFANRVDFTLLFRTPFVFMACGLLATFTSLSGVGGFSDLLIAMGYASMFILLTILLCDIAHRWGISVLVLCGIKELVSLVMVAGHLLGGAWESGLLAAPDNTALRAVLVALVLVVSVATLTDKVGKRWGAALFGAEDIVRYGDERGAFTARCTSIAEAHGLSPREREVFILIALGKPPAAIGEELCIAEGTLKSHTQRIYQKLGVHSREELRALAGTPPI